MHVHAYQLKHTINAGLSGKSTRGIERGRQPLEQLSGRFE
jgi:hypothetical protein